MVIVGGRLVVVSVVVRARAEAAVGMAGVAGTLGLADGGHSEYDTWQTLWVQRARQEW